MTDLSIQDLIDSGTAWKLEGSIGRQCMAAIEAGQAMLGPKGHRDYYGNYIPSRFEVEPGTMGSPEYAGRCPECGGPPDDGAGHDCEVS